MSAEPLTLPELEAAAAQLGTLLPAGAVVWLEGPLGAGKTTFARALASGRGIADAVTSPTYALVHHYEGPRGAAYHLDCYRLRHPDDAADLDWETLAAADLLLIEWPERAGPWAPRPSHRVRLAHAGDDTRLLEVTA